MSILVDTNVLLRRTQPDHEHHLAAVESVAVLLGNGETLRSQLQNISKFWNVATRPLLKATELGFSIDFTLSEVEKIERVLTLLYPNSLKRREKACVWRKAGFGWPHDSRRLSQ